MRRNGDYEQLVHGRPIDNAEREAFDQDASSFLERRSATERMCGGSGNSHLDSRLKPKTGTSSRLGVVGNFLQQFNLSCGKEANFDH